MLSFCDLVLKTHKDSKPLNCVFEVITELLSFLYSWMPSEKISSSVKYGRGKHVKLQAKENLTIPEVTFSYTSLQ